MSRDDAPDERIADTPPKHTFLWVLLSGWVLAIETWLRSHGGRPLRLTIRTFWAAVGVGGVVLLVGPVINPPLTLDDITASASTATETWIAREFAADYTVDVADDGTLTTDVEERITAFFGDEVDESAIERVIATEYQGHDLSPSAITATLDGEPIDVEQDDSATRLTLTLDAGERLRGDHEFVIRYTLENLAYDTTDAATDSDIQLLQWDVFGPSWPVAVAGIDITVDLPREIDAQLVRQPRGELAWTLVGAGAWLDAEADSPPGRTVYGFTNDQNIPPNASAIFTVALEPNTVVMPPLSPVFLVQSFGPLAPLAFLLLTLLLAVAARAVAWSDARGEPWFVARYEPPRDIGASLAAHILRSPHALELARELQRIPAATKRGDRGVTRDHLLATGQVARRTGRLGNLAHALRLYASGPEQALQITRGLREVPDGFVRDAFIAAPLALTLVQWGLVRQLSYQAPLAVVWWPGAFVIVSTIVAAAVLALALTARPLTSKGALVKQHLRGIGVFSERTSLLERGTLRDEVLPFAVLTAPAREAADAIARRVEVELGGPIPRRSWHTADFLTAPRIAIRAVALVLVAGSIAAAALLTSPLAHDDDYLAYSGDVPGSLWTQVESFDAAAELSRGPDGGAMITASETVGVLFEEGGSLPPQVVRQWADVVDGQSLDVSVQRVLLDGRPVDHVIERLDGTVVMRTIMTTPVFGAHELRVDYTVGSAAVASVGVQGGAIVDRVRWAALLDGWRYAYGGEADILDPLRIEVTIDDSLEAEAGRAGWITVDTSADEVRDWTPDVIEFGAVSDDPAADAAVETQESAADSATRTLEIGQDDNGTYPWRLTVRDLGVMLDFPSGTFAGPDAGALSVTRVASSSTIGAIAVLGALAAGIGLIGWRYVRTRRVAVADHGPWRDALRWLAPASALASVIVFVWSTGDLPGDDPAFVASMLMTLVALAGSGIALWVGWRKTPGRQRRP